MAVCSGTYLMAIRLAFWPRSMDFPLVLPWWIPDVIVFWIATLAALPVQLISYAAFSGSVPFFHAVVTDRHCFGLLCEFCALGVR